MSTYTPDELAIQFKELILFTQQVCDILVTEIRRRANVENTCDAASAIDEFFLPTSPNSFGWVLLKSFAFILNRFLLIKFFKLFFYFILI